MRSRVWLGLILCVGLASGCATRGATILSSARPGVDLASFGTYGLLEPLDTDRANGARTMLSTQLIDAMTREMDRRGLEPSPEPELLINFYVNTEQRMAVHTVPTSSSFYFYRSRRYGTWTSYQTHVREYTRGTLAIDVIERATMALAWEGVAQGRMRTDVRQMAQEQVDAVVSDMMQRFTPIDD